MVSAWKIPTRVEITQWWIAVKTHYALFFRLMSAESVDEIRFHDMDALIRRVETHYYHLQQAEYPYCATAARNHLLHSMKHLLDSLWNLHQRYMLESNLRFNIAKIDMMMMAHDLAERGVES